MKQHDKTFSDILINGFDFDSAMIDQKILFQFLKNRFIHQQFYKMKYWNNRFHYSKQSFTPIEFMGDREFYWIRIFIHRTKSLEHSLESVNGDSDFILQIIRKYPRLLKEASNSLRMDRDFILKAIDVNYESYYYAKVKDPLIEEKFEKENERRKLIDQQTQEERNNSINYKKCTDEELILTAIELDDNVIKRAPKKFKKEKSLILKVVRRNAKAIRHLGDRFKKDREVVMEAIKSGAYVALEIVYKVASDLMNDKELIMAAIQKDAYSLRFASKDLKNDKEVVMEAVQKYGTTLSEASKELQNDREIAMLAVENPNAFEYVSMQIRYHDRELVMKAVQGSGDLLCYAGNFQKDREIVLTALTQSHRALSFTDSSLRTNREFLLEAIKRNGCVIQSAKGYISTIDKEMILEAIYQNGFTFEYSDELYKARMNTCYPELHLP